MTATSQIRLACGADEAPDPFGEGKALGGNPNFLDFWLWPLQGITAGAREKSEEIPWATPNESIADLPTMRLRRFATVPRGAAPVLIVAPFAVHDSGIADLCEGHSLVATLAACGLGPIFLTEWKPATPDMATLSIDSYLADLNVAVDLVAADAGALPDLVGLCQGGWMSLLYAAAFPAKLRRLVAIGAPVDTSHASALAEGAQQWFSTMAAAFAADRIIDGATTLAIFRTSGSAETQAAEILQVEQAKAPAAHAAFAAWDARTVDLPGRYYRDVLTWLFRENRLANGTFPAFGRPAPLSAVRAPLYLLAGAQDRIAPPPQVHAAASLVGTAQGDIVCAQADCGHLSLFLGAKTLGAEWVGIGDWLRR
jgi:poly(3-hydroxyalkanoate) synthetase